MPNQRPCSLAPARSASASAARASRAARSTDAPARPESPARPKPAAHIEPRDRPNRPHVPSHSQGRFQNAKRLHGESRRRSKAKAYESGFVAGNDGKPPFGRVDGAMATKLLWRFPCSAYRRVTVWPRVSGGKSGFPSFPATNNASGCAGPHAVPACLTWQKPHQSPPIEQLEPAIRFQLCIIEA